MTPSAMTTTLRSCVIRLKANTRLQFLVKIIPKVLMVRLPLKRTWFIGPLEFNTNPDNIL